MNEYKEGGEGEGACLQKVFKKGVNFRTDASLSPIDPVALSGTQEDRPKTCLSPRRFDGQSLHTDTAREAPRRRQNAGDLPRTDP